ncbi:MAG TPA: HemK/PrmC family methyltransferase [Candidatus Saccharimonadia bacterium]|nr:HemK/PrmC family methyltransferase [Candidatus Saccharimonadia bacterium]
MNINSLPTNNSWLKKASRILRDNDIDSAYIDALIILSFVLDKSKTEIIANPNQTIRSDLNIKANKLIQRRLASEPIAYLTNSIEFYGYNFFVDSRVLVPRPESESFINLLHKLGVSSFKYISDIGCGSGVLGITAKLEFPDLKVELLDNDPQALEVAKTNVLKHNREEIEVKNSDLTSKINPKCEIMLANLPYVPDDMPVSRDISFEPKSAIFSGPDGLSHYHKLITSLEQAKLKPKFILIECLAEQSETMTNLLSFLSYRLIADEGLVSAFKKN